MAVIIPARPARRLEGQAAGQDRPAGAAAGRDLLRQRARPEAVRHRAQGRVLRQHDVGMVLRRDAHGPGVHGRRAGCVRDGAAVLPRAQAGRTTALIDHQLTRYRLGDMLRRVELCRSVARRSLAYARLSPADAPVRDGRGQGHRDAGGDEGRRRGVPALRRRRHVPRVSHREAVP
ncbi:MAG: hypothetical protein MZU91_12185 [Desulfosudis oleivorans]|nr:hypothetical protein [Desulfosudis oleivorans]